MYITLRRVHATIVAVKKALSITHSKFAFVALGTHREMHVRHIVICGISDCTIVFHIAEMAQFSKKLLNINCVLIFSAPWSETFLILQRTEQDMIKNVYRYSCKVPVILVQF